MSKKSPPAPPPVSDGAQRTLPGTADIGPPKVNLKRLRQLLQQQQQAHAKKK